MAIAHCLGARGCGFEPKEAVSVLRSDDNTPWRQSTTLKRHTIATERYTQ